jgi:hypothetical protein
VETPVSRAGDPVDVVVHGVSGTGFQSAVSFIGRHVRRMDLAGSP